VLRTPFEKLEQKLQLGAVGLKLFIGGTVLDKVFLEKL
jgi:hypothetical protein